MIVLNAFLPARVPFALAEAGWTDGQANCINSRA
jgi:hypothetical protein